MAEIQTVDPRPKVVEHSGQYVLEGWTCDDCGYSILHSVPRCPECLGHMAAAYFGPEGVVHGSTALHVRVPGQQGPFALAYVRFPDGPRVLAHTPGDKPLPLGANVELSGLTVNGDISVKPIEGEV